MECPICKRDDSHPDCTHLLAVIDQEEGCCDGAADSLFSSFILARGAVDDYEDAIGERGEDWMTRSDAIDYFESDCRAVSDGSRSWSSYDDSPCFGGSCRSYYVQDIDAALKELERRLGLAPAEKDVKRNPKITRRMKKEAASRAATLAEAKAAKPTGTPIPPTMPTDFGGLVAPGRVHPHVEAYYGALRRRAYKGEAAKPSLPTSKDSSKP